MFICPMMILVVVNALIGSSATAEGVQQERGVAQGVAPYYGPSLARRPPMCDSDRWPIPPYQPRG